MGVAAPIGRMLDETSAAFDGVAANYDRSNRENSLLRAMRQRTLEAVRQLVAPPAQLLDLGCGPATDAITLAREGYVVTGIDASPAMIAEAVQRLADEGVQDRARVMHLGIDALSALPANEFDAAYSNFGPLNCVPDLGAAAQALHLSLRPGGVLVASVIGRIVPWELVRYLPVGQAARARVRFARGFVAVPLNGRRVWTRYYTPREFTRDFVAAGFDVLSVRALGLLLPPPYLDHIAVRHSTLIKVLQALEDRVAAWPAVRHMGDHFLVAMRRR